VIKLLKWLCLYMPSENISPRGNLTLSKTTYCSNMKCILIKDQLSFFFLNFHVLFVHIKMLTPSSVDDLVLFIIIAFKMRQ